MKRLRKPLGTALLTLALAACVLVACQKVPVTGRSQLNLLKESDLIGMATANYSEVLQQAQVVPLTQPDAQMIQRVGQRVTAAVETFLRENGLEDRLKGVNWEINLIESAEVNAWAMPGGKVAFYTGILPIAKDEAGVAAIMGHEIAHVVARHGNERMSQQLAVQLGGAALSVALQEQPDETRNLFLMAYGAGSNLGVLKYSRTHETEADKMGVIFMAMAGYEPEASVGVWERMAELGGGNGPEFLSTHPSSESRIRDLTAYMPEARKYFRPQP